MPVDSSTPTDAARMLVVTQDACRTVSIFNERGEGPLVYVADNVLHSAAVPESGETVETKASFSPDALHMDEVHYRDGKETFRSIGTWKLDQNRDLEIHAAGTRGEKTIEPVIGTAKRLTAAQAEQKKREFAKEPAPSCPKPKSQLPVL